MSRTSATMTGGEFIVASCERHGVTHIFGYPGGANIPIFDALYESPIKLILARHEQGAAHMADGYARATGRPGVVLVTSGPGATNALTGIMTAHMDSVPMIVFSGQTVSTSLGLDAFQEADIIGMSYPVVKHSYLVKNVNDLPRVVKEAFYLAQTGRPGPVLIDVPKNISSAKFEPDFDTEMDLPGYEVPSRGNPESIGRIAEYLAKSRRPVILAGHGVIIANAAEELTRLAEKLKVPVATSLLGKGAIPENHPLSLGMVGMHGTPYANMAVRDCDLIFSIGGRWDDRIVGNRAEFCTKAIKLHIDVDKAEKDKMIAMDLFLHADARLALIDLHAVARPGDHAEWRAIIDAWKMTYALVADRSKGVTATVVLEALNRITTDTTIVTTDVGQHQMWAAQFCKTAQPRTWITSGGAGTMGFGFPAALGAQLGCPGRQVVAIVGDGGFQMTAFELSTAAIHALPVKVLVLDNRFLGMVRQWQDLFYDRRLMGVDLVGNPDFVKLGEAYNVRGFHIATLDEVEPVLREALAYPGPAIIHAEIVREDNVFPMIPSGAGYDKMLLGPPAAMLDKPQGST